MLERLRILAAWAAVKRDRAGLRTRADIERLQARRWRRLQPALARTPAYASLAGKPLDAFPVIGAAEAREGFAARNSRGVSLEAAREAADAAEAGQTQPSLGGLTAGWSSGTGGRRGLFLVSPQERRRYVGAALATLLPGSVLAPWRIALVLRADSALYRAVEGAGRFRFQFHGLDEDPAARARALAAFAPHILIAPAHVLADLARRAQAGEISLAGLKLGLAGAEPMGAAEQAWIAAVLGAPVAPIYQATEGFLAAPCRLGTLHLNEDWLIVERAWLDRDQSRFSPVITDLARTTQPTVRVRLDDVVLDRRAACPCGSPLAPIERVEGRVGDVWSCARGVQVFPGETEAVVSATLGPSADWLACQVAPDRAVFVGPEPGAAALRALLGGRGMALAVETRAGPPVFDGPKRRRVRGMA